MAKAGVTHHITIADKSAGTPKIGLMLPRQKKGVGLRMEDFPTIAPRVMSDAELTHAQLNPAIESIWFQDDWSRGIGGRNHRTHPGFLQWVHGGDVSRPNSLRASGKMLSLDVDAEPSVQKTAGGYAVSGTEFWCFGEREVYKFTVASTDVFTKGVQPQNMPVIYRNGLDFEGYTIVPSWLHSDDSPWDFIYKGTVDANWTLSTLNVRGKYQAATTESDGARRYWLGNIRTKDDSTVDAMPTMAIVDQTTSTAAASKDHSFSHVVSAGTNIALIVAVAVDEGGPGAAPPATVTYNSASLTQVGAGQDDPGNDQNVSLWYLAAPSTGSNTLAMTYAGGTRDWVVYACSLPNVNQSTPLGTQASANGTSDTPTVDVTAAVGDIVIAVVQGVTSGAVTTGAGQKERADASPATGARGHVSTERAQATTVTMSATLSSSLGWAIMGAPIKPATAVIAADATTVYTSIAPDGTLEDGDTVMMDSELMTVGTVTNDGDDSRIVVTRARLGTTAAAHTAAKDIYEITTSTHQVRSSTDPSNAGSFASAVSIGDASSPITAVVGRNEVLYVCKTDGIYAYYREAGIVEKVFDLTSYIHPDNGKGAIAWQGRVLIPLATSGVWEIAGSELVQVIDPILDALRHDVEKATHTYQTFIRAVALAGDVDTLYAVIYSEVSPGSNQRIRLFAGHVLDDGSYRWMRIDGNQVAQWGNGIWISEPNWVSLFPEGLKHGADQHRRVWGGGNCAGRTVEPHFLPLDGDVDFTYAHDNDFYMFTTAWDANLPNVSKHFVDITFTGTFADDAYLVVSYRVDGGSWVYLTGSSGTSTITATRRTLSFGDEVTGKVIELRLTFDSTDSDTLVEMESFTLKAQIRPASLKSIPITAYLAEGQTLLNGAIGGTPRNDIRQLVAWNAQAAEVAVATSSLMTTNSYDCIFLPGAFKVDESRTLRHGRPEYLVTFLLVET